MGKTEATKEEVIAAAKTANAHKFIMQMKEGYSSSIGEEELNFLEDRTVLVLLELFSKS